MLKIKKLKKRSKVYDINVEDNHNFYANNILVHNCVESFSVTKTPTSWIEEVIDNQVVRSESNGLYHSCNLLSINLGVIKTKTQLKRVCRTAVRILDNSIDLGTMPVKEAENSSEWLRNVGIGTVGVADWMAWNKLSYTKEEDLNELEKIIEQIAWYCYEASIELAIEKGPYKYFDKANYDKMFGKDVYELDRISPNGFKWSEMSARIKENGIRNFYLLAIAPNTSCQSGYNKVITNDGVTDIYTILEEQSICRSEVEKQEPHWIELPTPIQVPTYEGQDVVERIWYNGKQPYIEIEFEDGKKYKFTYNHQLLVVRDGEEIWTRCDELEEGDDIKNIGTNF